MDLQDLKKKKIDDLRYIGKMLGIKSMTKMSKQTLIEAILNVEKQEAPAEIPVKVEEKISSENEKVAEQPTEEVSQEKKKNKEKSPKKNHADAVKEKRNKRSSAQKKGRKAEKTEEKEASVSENKEIQEENTQQKVEEPVKEEPKPQDNTEEVEGLLEILPEGYGFLRVDKYVSGKDVILHIIGKIGVDGALYKSMEFGREGLSALSMADRLCIANMAIEAGAKNGIFEVDDITLDYLKAHNAAEPVIYKADEDAVYDEIIDIDLSAIEPTVAFPHLPENARTFSEIGDIKIDQVIIGSCTNGRLEDLQQAAEILKGRKCAKGVRVIIIPATQQIYLDAMEQGLLKIFIESGAVVSTPTCGPCLGGHMGILAAGERAVATTNRNFVGRMGHVESEIYLASPATAAASAITGKITSPWEVMSK